MTDTPKLHAYAVTAIFGALDKVEEARVVTTQWIAYGPEVATAAVAVTIAQAGEKRPLMHVGCNELTEEWLAAALNAIRTGGKGGQVAHLKPVETTEPPQQPPSGLGLLSPNPPDPAA